MTRGHRVASGQGGDPRFPQGTIRPQLPFFEAAVPGLHDWLGGAPYPGTINLTLNAAEVTSGRPDHIIADVPWTDAFPPETFFLSRCRLEGAGARHPAFLYIPSPATKPDHFQASNVVELLAPLIPALAYGDRVTLYYPAGALTLTGD